MPLDQAPIALGLLRPTVPNITEDNQQDDGDGANVDLGAVQNQMLGIFHGRLTELGKSSRYIESLPDEVKLIIEGLGSVQVKHNELQNQYKRECLVLEKKVRYDCL